MVCQYLAGAGTGPIVLHLGGLCELRQLSTGLEASGTIFFAGHYLGEGASSFDAKRFYGKPRMVLLWLARRRGPQVLRAEQCAGCLAHQEDPASADGTFDG